VGLSDKRWFRLRGIVRRNWRMLVVVAVLWLVWAVTALALYPLPDDLLPALLLLALFLFALVAGGLLWLRRELRRERQREQDQLLRYAWLQATIRPTRPLPPLRGGMARPELLLLLWQEIHRRRPRQLLEMGSGLSTVVMAMAMGGSGRLTALEDDVGHAVRTRRMLADHGLQSDVRVVDASLKKYEIAGEQMAWYDLAGLDALAGIDLLFVDGPAGYLRSQSRYPALPLLCERLAADAIIFVDDVDRPQEKHMLERWLQDYPQLSLAPGEGGGECAVLQWRRAGHQTGGTLEH